MENKGNKSFNYTYSASQQEEIEQIRSKYLYEEKHESKIDELRRLDRQVTNKGKPYAISLGVVSSLAFGLGMACITEWSDKFFIHGIFIGIIGILGVSLSYPLYLHLTHKEQKRLSQRIIALADELSEK